ncbi:MAG: hypothetical protein ACKVPX_03760 [Myxococcaceae bacterium]
MNAEIIASGMVATLLVACTIPEVDISYRQCPCVSGYVCDVSANVCYEAPAAGGGGTGAVRVTNLRPDWSTAHQIRWRWDPEGVADNLGRYELVVGTTEEDVRNRTGAARVYTPTENPELARFLLQRTIVTDPVVFTTADELQPDTRYFAQLTAFDTTGDRSYTNIAQARTMVVPTGSRLVFSEAEMPGFSIPTGFARICNDRAFEGSCYYEYVAQCPNGQGSCWENLRRQSLGFTAPGLSQGAFATTAIFTLAVASDAGRTSYWTGTRLCFDVACADVYFVEWTLRSNDQYRVQEFPLRAFLSPAGTPLSAAVLNQGVFEISFVGGDWPSGTHVRVDKVSVAW